MMIKRHHVVLSFAFVSAMSLATTGCDTKKKADTALDNASKLMTEYQRLGKNMNDTITSLKEKAKDPVTAIPAQRAKVPPIAAKATGKVDIASERTGKGGTGTANIDGNGKEEQVASFVPAAAEPSSTEGGNVSTQSFDSGGADGSVFVSWEGDAESEDEGVCYLAWESEGAAWFIAAPCGETTGGYVCHATETEAACSACNVAGDCTPCDMNDENFTCEWPE